MKLVTHNGNFHYDEVLATTLLREIYEDAEVIRTRNEEIIKTGDIVYDVGGVFNPDEKRFDHHQNTFVDTFSPDHTTKLSSCGLIYKYYCDKLFEKYNFDRTHSLYDEIKYKIYNEFFQYADALDNGVNIFSKMIPRTLGDVVAGFNVYNCKSRDEEELEELQNSRFFEAQKLVRIDFINYIEYIFNDYVPSYMNVCDEMEKVDGEIYITNLKVPPNLILTIDLKLKKDLKYVIYKNKHAFRILALPVEKGTFTTRVPLFEKWQGLRNEELSKKSGIEGCIFVHASGFTGGNKTLGGAIKMCEVSLENFKKGRLDH